MALALALLGFATALAFALAGGGGLAASLHVGARLVLAFAFWWICAARPPSCLGGPPRFCLALFSEDGRGEVHLHHLGPINLGRAFALALELPLALYYGLVAVAHR